MLGIKLFARAKITPSMMFLNMSMLYFAIYYNEIDLSIIMLVKFASVATSQVLDPVMTSGSLKLNSSPNLKS